MVSDKVKRVKSVRKWLEKAEKSYDRNQEISGELNLIMAQAEMQRLKETRKPSAWRAWGVKAMALVFAVGLFSAANYGYGLLTEKDTPASIASTTADIPKKMEVTAPSGTVGAGADEIARPLAEAAEVMHSMPEEQALEQPQQVMIEAPVVRAAPPVLSEREIQSVVGEAGRALRGET